ncbi:carbamoyltransferase [Pseudomonas sp. NFACC02]|uniref:carbamoyltransferase family protein n=1 Tax=Pseudomonas sp. NFACC02 TaxID=1566250 RepID=UPI0008AD0B12|nr:carbamoyltransferase C-terminal domain-containing protein [Pseudomonas sp. NFACC02]SEQ54449.1 carbamoyltransferase [Pseudomonas sp. NFACC02]
MIILGLSGLPYAQSYLRKSTQSLSEIDERICQGLDSAACLVIDGQIVAAAAEERFTGEKGTGALPLQAINYCLQTAGVLTSDVHVIAHGFDYDKYRRVFSQDKAYYEQVVCSRALIASMTEAGWDNVESRFHPVEHHVAHAASAFYPSGFSEALCIVSDGMGEVDSLTIFDASCGELKRIHRQRISDSLGLLYSICTRFLGFAFNSDEYKVMGLAAYGDPRPYRSKLQQICHFNPTTGHISINWPRESLTHATLGYPAAMGFLQETVGFPPRRPNTPLEETHYNFAAGLQERLEQVLQEFAKYWLKKTGRQYLCLAGGTFLNCKANEKLCNLPGLQGLFVQPASGDDGTSIGAALAVAAKFGEANDKPGPFDPYIGPQYTRHSVEDALSQFGTDKGIAWKWLGVNADYFTSAAADISNDLIIAWFHGRMEFGPRALGNRSILGLPSGNSIKERINSVVKFREAFRPFAPAVLADDCDKLFITKKFAPMRYMLATARATELGRTAAAGVVHADGSARVQIVDADINPIFYRLLTAIKAATGFGCTVNTSFNVKGQPLIMQPFTAIETFLKTGLDKLYIEGYVVWKN